jgi:hypothetical protein
MPSFEGVGLRTKYMLKENIDRMGVEPVGVLNRIWTTAQSNVACQRGMAAREALLVKVPSPLKKLNRLIRAKNFLQFEPYDDSDVFGATRLGSGGDTFPS